MCNYLEIYLTNPFLPEGSTTSVMLLIFLVHSCDVWLVFVGLLVCVIWWWRVSHVKRTAMEQTVWARPSLQSRISVSGLWQHRHEQFMNRWTISGLYLSEMGRKIHMHNIKIWPSLLNKKLFSFSKQIQVDFNIKQIKHPVKTTNTSLKLLLDMSQGFRNTYNCNGLYIKQKSHSLSRYSPYWCPIF